MLPVGGSLALHIGIAAIMAGLSTRSRAAQQVALQIAVMEVPAEKEAPKPPPPPPPARKQEPKPLRVARAPRAPQQHELPPPPPPTQEAKNLSPAPVVVTGITLESTSQGGSFAVGVGNTLQGTPSTIAREPETVKPYKAEKYAPAAQVTELPRPLNGESVNLRKYYPPQAVRDGFEGDVVLRLLIDADGSIARVEIVNDPGEGLGAAAAKMVRAEYRFSPATVNGVPVATTVPFTVHFTLN
jgi:protein TonB